MAMAEPFYNRKGIAMAYVDDDGESIYLHNGTPVASLSGESVYSFEGKHLGWFVNGWIRDNSGGYVFFTDKAENGPVRPLARIDFPREPKKPKPAPCKKEKVSTKVSHETSWSSLDWEDFFRQ
jgi:hypothetical protein